MRTYEALGNTYTRCCATCRAWNPSNPANWNLDQPAAVGSCNWNNDLMTLDLAICSKWQDKDVTE